MNIVKNMEAIFVAALVVASATGFATASSPAPAPQQVVAQQQAPMQVVTISAKRLSAAEKSAVQ